jgi:hypothetical protein
MAIMSNTQLIELQKLFNFKSGIASNSVEREHSKISENHIHFIRPSHKQNTSIDAFVDKRFIDDKYIFPADTIYVSTNGQGSHTFSYVSTEVFVPNSDIYVLLPKQKMSIEEKLYYAFCITKNRYRFNYNRKPKGDRIKKVLVPALMPNEWKQVVNIETIAKITKPAQNLPTPELKTAEWATYRFDELFEVKKGKRLVEADFEQGDTPFVAAIDKNNGYRDHIGQDAIHEGNTITVSYNGSVGEAFYQPKPFYASDDINVLYPKFKLVPSIALFLAVIIRKEKYRFNYGRKWDSNRMKVSFLKLPTKNRQPDWDFMTNFVQTLPFSSQV